MLIQGYYLQIPWYQVLFAHVSPLLSEYVPSGQIVFDHLTLVKFAATIVASVRSAKAKFALVKSAPVKSAFLSSLRANDASIKIAFVKLA